MVYISDVKTDHLKERVRINNQIRAHELRIIGPEGENFGLMPIKEALERANDLGLDLIEISPNAVPPVAKITEYGKFQYEENKKLKTARTKVHTAETKTVQVKIGTGEHDLNLKARRASEWLKEGNRIKIDLFLAGRAKYLDQKFLKERLDRILHLITEEYKVADEVRKSPKGLSIVIERALPLKKQNSPPPNQNPHENKQVIQQAPESN